jgi:hypothetical protein
MSGTTILLPFQPSAMSTAQQNEAVPTAGGSVWVGFPGLATGAPDL